MGEPRILWRRPQEEPHEYFAKHDLAGAFAGTTRARLRRRAAEALFKAGIPRVAAAQTPLEDAVGLLKLAAEVEHALMVQYLYAALSVEDGAQRAIAHVAVQEMGHLITVQNLLIALNGTSAEGLPAGLHLGRDGIRTATSERNPLPLIFEPVSRSTLAKFVIIERPADIADPGLAARIDALEQEVATQGIEPHPVYALYAAIRWLFQADDTSDAMGLTETLGFEPGWHLADSDFKDPAIGAQFGSEPIEWHSIPALIIVSTTTRAEALAALDAIAAQGEGLPGAADSHFSTFLQLLDQFENGDIDVISLPRTPIVASQPAPEDPAPTPITSPYAVLWAELFNAIYTLLLIDIAWAISQPRGGSARQPLIDLTFNLMKRVIKPLASHIAKLPLAPGSVEIAGPPFGLGAELLPTTLQEFAQRFRDGLDRQHMIVAALRARPEFAGDTGAAQRLAALDQLEARRAPYLPQGV